MGITNEGNDNMVIPEKDEDGIHEDDVETPVGDASAVAAGKDVVDTMGDIKAPNDDDDIDSRILNEQEQETEMI